MGKLAMESASQVGPIEYDVNGDNKPDRLTLTVRTSGHSGVKPGYDEVELSVDVSKVEINGGKDEAGKTVYEDLSKAQQLSVDNGTYKVGDKAGPLDAKIDAFGVSSDGWNKKLAKLVNGKQCSNMNIKLFGADSTSPHIHYILTQTTLPSLCVIIADKKAKGGGLPSYEIRLVSPKPIKAK